MFELTWLSVEYFGGFFANFLPTNIVYIFKFFLILINYVVLISSKRRLTGNDYLPLVLLVIAIPFRNFFSLFNIVACTLILSRRSIDRILLYKIVFESLLLCLFIFNIYTGRIHDALIKYDKADYFLHTFGFGNPNNAARFFFNIIITLYLLWKRYKAPVCMVFAFILDYVIYRFCHARTMHYAFMTLLTLSVIFENKTISRHLLKPLSLMIPSFMICTFFMPKYILSIPALNFINTLTTGRMELFNIFMNNVYYKNWVFGLVSYTGPTSLPLDSCYLQVLFTGGIFFVLYLIFAFKNALYSELNVFRTGDVPLLVSYAVAGFTESLFVQTDITGLIFWIILYRKWVGCSYRVTTNNTRRIIYGSRFNINQETVLDLKNSRIIYGSRNKRLSDVIN